MKIMLPILTLALAAAFSQQSASATLPEANYDSDTVALWRIAQDDGKVVLQEAPGAPDLLARPEATIAEEDGVWAVHFPGRMRYTTGGPKHPLEVEDAVTLEVWLKIDVDAPTDQVMGVFQHITWPQGGFRMRITADGRLEWIVLAGGEQRIAATNLELPRGQWLHLAGTYDGHEMAVYVDGQLERAMGFDDGILKPDGKPYTLIGYTDPDEWFAGWIHAVRVSNIKREFSE